MASKMTRMWLKPFIKPLRPVFNEVVAMSAFINILALAVPIFTLQVYDRVVGQGGVSTLQGLVVGMALIVLFDFILRQSRSRIMQTIALRVDVLVGRKLFEKFVSLPMQTLEGQSSAHWQSLFRDADVVRNTLSGASALLIADLPFAIFFLILIFVIAKPIAIVLMVVLPIFLFVAWRSSAVMSAAGQEERKTSHTRDSLIAEMINARTTIKALALDGVMRPMWEDMHAGNIETAIIRGTKTDHYSNVGASLSMTTSIALTTFGALAIMEQEMTVGSLIATNMLSGRLLGPLNQLVGQWRTYSSFFQSVDRMGELFATPSERTESEVEFDKPEGEVKLENVTFAYAENLPRVVNNIEITFTAGGVHALVGRNGSGKSTMLKLFQGLYKPMDGRILLDGADISQFSRSEMALWMGYVPQDCILFTGNVRDNIVQRVPDASDEEVLRAAQAAGVHQFIIDMPDGYSTEIGEAGQRLSGGQRQRIAIARALVGDPPIVLLDEPSSSLDRQAEYELRNTLTEIGKKRTVIMVTHSPILLATCDDLVALDKGRVALAGPSKDILPRLFGTQPQKKPGQTPPAGPPQPDKPQQPAGPQQKAPAPAAPKSQPTPQPEQAKLPVENPAPAAQVTEPAPKPKPEQPKPAAADAPTSVPLARIPVAKVPASEAIPGTPPPAEEKKPTGKQKLQGIQQKALQKLGPKALKAVTRPPKAKPVATKKKDPIEESAAKQQDDLDIPKKPGDPGEGNDKGGTA